MLVEPKESENQKADSSDTVIKEEISLNLRLWLPLFYVIYFCSFLIPSIFFMMYIMLFYLPYFLEIRNFISLFTSLPSIIASLTIPFVIIICYLIHLFIIALITRWFWRYSEKKSPSKSGIIPRNIPSKTLNYYHFRSFIIKYPKNAFSRGPFPWLLKWMYNFVGTNIIGKGSVIEEQLAGDRFVEVGENTYIGTNPGISSHSVEGVFGNIAFAKVKIGNNFTAAGFNFFGPGMDSGDNSWWLPMTGTTKYNILKGNNYYFGAPLRKIFKKRLMDILRITEEDLKRAEDLKEKLNLSKKKRKERIVRKKEMNENLEEQKIDTSKIDYTIDFVTTSAISKIGYKFLGLYIPILWISGYMAVAVFFDVSKGVYELTGTWIITMFLLPVWLFVLYFIFVFGIAVFTKAFILIINMIHKPKEGVFRAEEGDKDYEFWRLRVELKKLVFWFMSNGPLPWVVMWGFRWFGVRLDFSSHLQDAWADGGFIEFGRNVTVGQGAVVMSSMVIGKYLIIKKVILEDYTLVGGFSHVSPGSILGKESVLGAFSATIPNQIMEDAWIYLGPQFARKLKPNKYAEQRRDIIYERHVDDEVKYRVEQEVNIDEDKKKLVKNNTED